MGRRVCSEPDCGNKSHCRGLCRNHYMQKWRRGEFDSGRGRPSCSVPGCDGQHRARGLCGKHYRRVSRADCLEMVPKIIGQVGCSEPDCSQKHYGRGLCQKHYRLVKRQGTLDQHYSIQLDRYSTVSDPTAYAPRTDQRIKPLKQPRLCSEPDCDDRHIARGLCSKHYRRAHPQAYRSKTSKPSENGRGCSVPGCDNRHFGHGLCSNHYNQERRSLRPRCVGPECNYPQHSHGLCQLHFKKAELNDCLDLFEPATEEIDPPVQKRKLTPDQVREIDAAVRKARRDFTTGVITRQQLDKELEACQRRARSYQVPRTETTCSAQ